MISAEALACEVRAFAERQRCSSTAPLAFGITPATSHGGYAAEWTPAANWVIRD